MAAKKTGQALVATAAILALLCPLAVAQNRVFFPFDMLKFTRFLKGGDNDGYIVSKRIWLIDPNSARRLSLRIVIGPNGVLALVVTFEPHTKKVFPHTLTVLMEGREPLTLEAFARQPKDVERAGEMYAVRLEEVDLGLIKESSSFRIKVSGWDETFQGHIDHKGIKVLRKFFDKNFTPPPASPTLGPPDGRHRRPDGSGYFLRGP